jgi:Flp pilus assembly pilin Flp
MACRRAAVWRLFEAESGQDLVEYAFLVVFLALLIVGSLQATETSIGAVYSRITDAIDGGS